MLNKEVILKMTINNSVSANKEKLVSKVCKGCEEIERMIDTGDVEGIWECEICGRQWEWGT